jgi:AcrR family transcriptional regulator
MGIAERKERDFRRREREILEAATRLFDRDDWQLVSIERIAQEAEIGKGTVYLHFPSKEAIYGRLAVDFGREVLERLRRIDAGQPPVERLRAAIHIFFAAHLEGRRCHRVIEYSGLDDFRRRLDEGTRAELQQVDQEITEIIHGIMREGIESGVFADRPIEQLMLAAHATLIGSVRLLGTSCGTDGDGDPQAFANDITRFVLAGLMFQDRVPEAGARTGEQE